MSPILVTYYPKSNILRSFVGPALAYQSVKGLIMSDTRRARNFAINAHGDQSYGHLPYIYHLDKVAEIVKDYGENAIKVAYLHDIIEDTSFTKENLESAFGKIVADSVSFVSDKKEGTRSEKKKSANSTLSKLDMLIPSNSIALIVKAADRLANLRAGNKIDMYRAEHEEFRNAAYRPGLCERIWSEINSIIKEEDSVTTKTVRIAVCMLEDGSYSAVGESAMSESEMKSFVIETAYESPEEGVELKSEVHWVEVEIPVKTQPPVIKGRIVE